MADRIASSASTTPEASQRRRGLDREHGERTGAVEFDRGQAQLLGNLCVFDLLGILQRQPLNPLGHIRAGRNGTPATKRLELDV